jgi:hypothetical protein
LELGGAIKDRGTTRLAQFEPLKKCWFYVSVTLISSNSLTGDCLIIAELQKRIVIHRGEWQMLLQSPSLRRCADKKEAREGGSQNEEGSCEEVGC